MENFKRREKKKKVVLRNLNGYYNNENTHFPLRTKKKIILIDTEY